MHLSTTFTKLLRVLQFRKHIKELTTACKRINQDGCYEFVTVKSKDKRSKKGRKKVSYRPILTVDHEHLSMIICQSYKPLHAKSMQFNKNTIAVTKGTAVKALYTMSNWIFIEILETGQTGFIPIYCLRSSESKCESPAMNNISLLNVSIYDKPRHSRQSIMSPPPGRFISSIGPCYLNNESKTQTFTRKQAGEESILSEQISKMTLKDEEQDAYGTLNFTPCQNRSFSVRDHRPKNRLRVMENYQRKFTGDISVLESEVVTPVRTPETNNDWRLVRRGDGKQGYIPKHIVTFDENFA